jgi:hypothetical protein
MLMTKLLRAAVLAVSPGVNVGSGAESAVFAEFSADCQVEIDQVARSYYCRIVERSYDRCVERRDEGIVG